MQIEKGSSREFKEMWCRFVPHCRNVFVCTYVPTDCGKLENMRMEVKIAYKR